VPERPTEKTDTLSRPPAKNPPPIPSIIVTEKPIERPAEKYVEKPVIEKPVERPSYSVRISYLTSVYQYHNHMIFIYAFRTHLKSQLPSQCLKNQ
jgi:hypothetical protein